MVNVTPTPTHNIHIYLHTNYTSAISFNLGRCFLGDHFFNSPNSMVNTDQ